MEQAEAFFQMCDINLVDPKHEPVAPTHSTPQCVRVKQLSQLHNIHTLRNAPSTLLYILEKTEEEKEIKCEFYVEERLEIRGLQGDEVED